MDPEEYRRKFRVLDLMLSSHSTLRDQYRRRSTALILLIMALSILATTLALSDSGKLGILSVDLKVKNWLAALTGLIFFLSIVELVVDWRGRAWAHGDAARRLGELKGKFRRADLQGERVDSRGIDLDQEYDQTTAAIVEIPNAAFNRLKAKHRRKIAVSKLLDQSPGAPLVCLRWRVFRDGLRAPESEKKTAGVLEESPPRANDSGPERGAEGK